LGLLNPPVAIVLAFCLLGFLLYRRVSLGITLTATALFLGFLALDWGSIPEIAYATVDPSTMEGVLTIAVVFTTLGIMWLSILYRETSQITKLSENISKLVKNPKIVLSALPAIIGFLPVSGGALMSAPIVDAEAEKLKLPPEKKAYVNLWFRHTIFPVYPLSQVLIITSALTGAPLFSIILLQIPTVLVMVSVGFIVGFRRTSAQKGAAANTDKTSSVKGFFSAFSPILTTIVVAVSLNLLNPEFSKLGLDVLTATFAGLTFLAAVSRINLKAFVKPLKWLSLYDVTLATYSAFLLRNIMKAAGIAEIFKPLVSSGSSANITALLTAIPMALGFLTGSPSVAIAIASSVLTGALRFTPKTSALLYISAYLGYVIAPTHLCFTFTAEYFKSPIGKIYKYVLPSFIVTFAAALTVYLLPFPF
jgi:integral membrane protein (TIGR00529 family)